jgi:hypothetical protein
MNNLELNALNKIPLQYDYFSKEKFRSTQFNPEYAEFNYRITDFIVLAEGTVAKSNRAYHPPSNKKE